jgi:hypothetical protein
VKKGDGEEEEDVDAAAALPHAVGPLRAPSVCCCGGERSAYCYGGAMESQGGDGEEEKDGNEAAAMAHAVAPVGAPSVHIRRRGEVGMRRRRGCYVFARGDVRGSAKRDGGGALRRVARLRQIGLLRENASVP